MKIITRMFLIVVLLLVINQLSFSQKMNEIFSRGTASDPDWIEIYNGSSTSLDISGFKIYDNGGQAGTKPKKEFPAGSVIPAYGYFVIVTDDTTESGFGISNSGEWVWLENVSGTVIDSVNIPALAAGQTYACAPDGGPMKVVSTITKGKSNIVLTQLLLPKYIQGLNGTNSTRIPYVFRVTIDNLLASTTYKYINQVINYADGMTTSGAGNVIFVKSSVDSPFVRTTGPTFNEPGPYGSLTTDANGSFTGWFITEPTGNARFTPGNYIFMRIRFNDGASGSTAVHWATTTDSIKVLNFGNIVSPAFCTGIYGRSGAEPKDFVFLYDNIDGTDRPLSSAVIETDGIDLASVTTTVQFYRDSVDSFVGAWGTIIPNELSNGVRRIERRQFTDGNVFPVIGIDEDGIWPSGVNTIDPIGGTTPIIIELSDATIPVELLSFSAIKNNNSITLNWITATETNNRGFEIQKSSGKGFEVVGFVDGNGTSSEKRSYSFTDNNVINGTFTYRLKQIDFNGMYEYSNEIEVTVNAPDKYSLNQNYPNPFNPGTSIEFQLPQKSFVTLKVYNILGVEIATLVNEEKPAGIHKINFNASELSSGMYIYKISAGKFEKTMKMLLLK
jgi:hypothetical protein